MSNFQLIVISLFVAFIVVGVGVFALFGGVFSGGGIGAVTIWGTEPQAAMDYLLDSLRSQDKSLEGVHYVEKDAATYESDLVNAMASGASPDLFLVDQEQLGGFNDKILPIPYSAVSQSQFVSSYIDEGQLFLTPQGALALPFSVDPLVMYWNRDLFGTAGLAQPPQYWNDLLTIAPKITSLDSSQNVKRAAVALGAWQNIPDAKAILSALFMQAGDFLTARNAQGSLVSTFGSGSLQAGSAPAESALRFYTEFGNPGKTTYSWNRSLPQSIDAFAAGQLAVYFGFASEYNSLAARNPNLRFAVAALPQLQNGSSITYGTLTGLAIPRAAANVAGAAAVAQKLTTAQAAGILIGQTGLPPARRDVPTDTSGNAVAEVFARSALMARGWVDPNRTATDLLFQTMIESVLSGRADPAGAVSEAAAAMAQLVPTHF